MTKKLLALFAVLIAVSASAAEVDVWIGGDFDSDGGVHLGDFYFFQECVSNSGPEDDAGPGCRFADFDDDTDVDLRDIAIFQNTFTGGE